MGRVLKLDEPLNAWGGLDPRTGTIIHHEHPQRGKSIAGTVLVLSESRGSGTNAQVFAQTWAQGNGPVAVVLSNPDYVLCAGAVVSQELYGVTCPVVVAAKADHDSLATGDVVRLVATVEHAEILVRFRI